MSHRHFCDFAGHNWQCNGTCECICGLPMEGNDHSKCPVERRACPDHSAEQQRSIEEAMSSEPDAAFMQESNEGGAALPHCDCGCAETESSKIVGWCFHCDHVYVSYSREIEDRHFADNCPDAPEELRKFARERLLKHYSKQEDRRVRMYLANRFVRIDMKMKSSFVRMRKRRRAVLVVPRHLSDLAPHLRRKNFYPIVLPAGVLDQELEGLWLSGRTLITDKPEELAIDDAPVLEFSIIDITLVKADDGAMADIISGAWTKFRLKTEGWFVLRLRQNSKHQIEFPE